LRTQWLTERYCTARARESQGPAGLLAAGVRPRSAASGAFGWPAELVVIAEGALDDMVKRRGRAGRVQYPEAVIAETAGCRKTCR
jgi:hypothetical protein